MSFEGSWGHRVCRVSQPVTLPTLPHLPWSSLPTLSCGAAARDNWTAGAEAEIFLTFLTSEGQTGELGVTGELGQASC